MRRLRVPNACPVCVRRPHTHTRNTTDACPVRVPRRAVDTPHTFHVYATTNNPRESRRPADTNTVTDYATDTGVLETVGTDRTILAPIRLRARELKRKSWVKERC